MGNRLSTDDRLQIRIGFIALLSVLVAFSLGGCALLEDLPGLGRAKVDNLQVGMVETSGFNSTQARFHTLTGRKSWREELQEGDTFSLEVEAEVNKGSLSLQVENPQVDVIWEKTITEGESADETITLAAGESGAYTIAIVGDGAGGRYELTWEQVD